jgi:hypothetical protein
MTAPRASSVFLIATAHSLATCHAVDANGILLMLSSNDRVRSSDSETTFDSGSASSRSEADSATARGDGGAMRGGRGATGCFDLPTAEGSGGGPDVRAALGGGGGADVRRAPGSAGGAAVLRTLGSAGGTDVRQALGSGGGTRGADVRKVFGPRGDSVVGRGTRMCN